MNNTKKNCLLIILLLWCLSFPLLIIIQDWNKPLVTRDWLALLTIEILLQGALELKLRDL